MQTRRLLLQQALAIPLALGSAQVRDNPEIICDQDLLSRESAAGYRLLLKKRRSGRLIVMAAVSQMNERHLPAIQSRVKQGAWLIWEAAAYLRAEQASHQSQQLLDLFGITLQPAKAVRQNARTLYLEYRWPTTALVRTFANITPVSCPPSEAIAHYEDVPAAIRKPVGRGGLVFLGSMLGPHLAAGDPEAQSLGSKLLQLTSL